MSISKKYFAQLVKYFDFKILFNEMGWNKDNTYQIITVDDKPFEIKGIAHKSGFHIFTCECGIKIPDKNIRKKIESKLTKLFQEHLIIFIDNEQKEQVWQLAVREAGSPVKITETKYLITQEPELLYQRTAGIFFALDEEENITIVDVTKRVSENFQQNNETVTKKFYESFKKEHTAFLKFITGIEDKVNLEWYASLMLNRLMFCYFIQKKGFLDNNLNYLQDKLQECREKKGKDNFYSFYRNFLLVLFHKALGSNQRNYESEIDFGKIPYLNGGLFDEHELEKNYKNIQIEDKAFGKLFTFFDEWNWHLDTRETSSGKDINPDVIGYIFEKYINDRAQMGAYYTKEDITDYISKNCILPWLFDEVQRNYPTPFKPDCSLWKMLKESGDEYIYDAVKKGIPEEFIQNADTSNADEFLFSDLPNEIRKGFNPELEKQVVDGKSPYLWELRKEWNKPAPDEIALPTEIYREVIERRKRYAEIRRKISSGEITEINDFITYNLNIRQFVQDTLQFSDDAKFIKEFYKALSKITILDPTCGSGAFIFAAMNILEPLYETCIKQMQEFVNNDGKGKHKFFEEILEQVNSSEHPNLEYFIYKSIILNNLYGVDLMNEAVEIAKLRLFLKLVAAVDVDYNKENYGLEPLPDIDFNIRTGNTLIGYVNKKQIDDIGGLFISQEDRLSILNKCKEVSLDFERYKKIQLSGNTKYEEFKKAKDKLEQGLKSLTKDLDGLLYMEQYKGHDLESKDYRNWLNSHQPFHWFAEFYEIINVNAGFDVIIGNPPYVGYTRKNRKTKKSISDIYKIIGYKTLNTSNLYAFAIERSALILNKNSKIGMIVPISAFSNNSMKDLQIFFKSTFGNIYISTFHQRPAQLFEGVLQRLNIFIADTINNNYKIYTSGINRWFSNTRHHLFDNINLISCAQADQHHIIKVGSYIELFLYDKYRKQKSISNYLSCEDIKNRIAYRTAGGGYWITFLNSEFDSNSLSNKYAYFQENKSAKVFSASLNSNLFWWYYSINYDLFNFKDYMIFGFKIKYPIKEIEQKLILLSEKMEDNLLNNVRYYEIKSNSRGTNKTVTYNKQDSKKIMDFIDCVLAEHYGFTQEELDFIINYDIKYRMGKEID